MDSQNPDQTMVLKTLVPEGNQQPSRENSTEDLISFLDNANSTATNGGVDTVDAKFPSDSNNRGNSNDQSNANSTAANGGVATVDAKLPSDNDDRRKSNDQSNANSTATNGGVDTVDAKFPSDNDGRRKSNGQSTDKKHVIDERMTDFKAIMKSFENTDKNQMSSTSFANASQNTSHWHEQTRSNKPKIPAKSEKSIWLSEMFRRGIKYTVNLMEESLFPHVQSYVLFFHDHSRLTNSENWLLSLQYFLQLLTGKSNSANNDLSTVFYLVEHNNVNEDVKIKQYIKGVLVCEDVLKETKDIKLKRHSEIIASKEIPVNESLSVLAKMGAEYKKLEVGIGLPLAVLRDEKCLVLEVEFPSVMTNEQSSNLHNRIAFFSNLMESFNDNNDTYKFYVIQRYDDSNNGNYNVAVRQYQNGSLINEDLYLEYEKFLSLCLVRMERDPNDEVEPRLPRKKAFLEITCPCYRPDYRKDSSSKTKRWSCADCLEEVIYGYDGYLYCLCGKANVNLKLTFRCNEDNHGSRFKPILGKVMTTYLDQLNPIEEINILFLGETGVGKSTFINSLANYFSFSTLEEASDSDLLALIPTRFTVLDDDMKPKIASFGDDTNEDFKTGQSATQSCKSYVIRHEDRMFQLIDTAGIGDTRGIDFDNKNFENIISFLSHFDRIHGVCVLLKPNSSRLSTVFQFCVKSLLCQLHKSASENILFLFTNTRGTFYKPGDTWPVLETLLNGIKQSEPYVTIPLERQNTFCFDSEAFRFLVALRNGIHFSDDHRKNFQQSWEHSAQESKRLLEYITKLKPHLVTETVSLSQCRKMVISLSKPLADISQNIQHNLMLLEEQEKNLMRATEDISLLSQKLYVPVLNFETKTFDKPRTVCTSESCVEAFTIDGIKKIKYKTVCHNPCYLKATAEVVNCSELLRCWAMNRTENCMLCTCSWRLHMHVYYELVHTTINKMDANVNYDLNNKESSFKVIRKVIEECEKRRKDLESEQDAITKACAKFAQFLKKNAITPYNDKIEEYLNYLIEVEKMKTSAHDDKKEAIAHFEKLKQEYLAQIQILEDNINSTQQSSSFALEPSEITATISGLHQLKMYGPTIKKMGNEMRNAIKEEHETSAVNLNTMAAMMVKKKKKNMFQKLKYSIIGKEFKSQPKSTAVFFD